MPPYLAFQLYSVASEIPCFRARSAVLAPASCSFSTPMIWSSVNRARFVCPSLVRPDSSSQWRKEAVAGQARLTGRFISYAGLTYPLQKMTFYGA
jgi:hypothetical protein